jgi:predicted DNA-binding ribbon-helix-helix protein
LHKRSISIAGHRTSIALEDPFWEGLEAMAEERNMSLAAMIAEIDQKRETGNLSSAVRLAVLDFYKQSKRIDRTA